MDIRNILENTWLDLAPETKEITRLADSRLVDRLNALQPASDESWRSIIDRVRKKPDRFQLFGTSGIRGIFDPDISAHPVECFVEHNRLTPLTAYFFGRSAGRIYRECRFGDPAWIGMDPRQSSPALAISVIRGLTDQGIPVRFGGIAPTSCYTRNPDTMTIIITASHNPVEYNGFKIFVRGRPMTRKLEIELEEYLQVFSDLHAEGFLPGKPEPAGTVQLDIREFEQRYFELLFNLAETTRLRIDFGSRLESCFLPLDLAYGAAACPVDEQGRLTRLSPPMALFLSLGVPVVGYGCIRDPSRMNYRIGAAYAYGETPESPETDELAKFARGSAGYADKTERLVFFPEKFTSPNRTLTRLLDNLSSTNQDAELAAGFPSFTGRIRTIALDHPDTNPHLATEIETEFMRRQALPGLMVDGDADRILVTSPERSKQDPPFLSGDMMIRFLVDLTPEDAFSEIVYTVESGLSLEKALKEQRKKRLSSGKRGFDIRCVTVGDRAIIDYFLERGVKRTPKGVLLGGEPSGHIIFAEPESGDLTIVDDPFITYIRLLNRLAADRFLLDRILTRQLAAVPDVYCARKPDARTAGGISLKEKKFLELWDPDRPGTLSRYAKTFIPELIGMFARGYSRGFHNGAGVTVSLTPHWTRLLEQNLKPSDFDRDLPIAGVRFGSAEILEEMSAGLHLDRRSWAGPDVIRLSFTVAGFRNRRIKMGECVFRNSGTSPKNAGYIKLWPIHPRLDISLSPSLLREISDAIALDRANWTERYIISVLRKQAGRPDQTS
ncbi:hypothetical protein JXA40_03285 [bacterium]|nr:hypothetical protein [candidate division CSSED10-310 bacterium]